MQNYIIFVLLKKISTYEILLYISFSLIINYCF